ncbi:site-specific integrase [Leptospira perolatii]|uniref:site-specific integrase n=1 Tax=Leptospira perolatii TaxID=2023191 RepID=UPI0013FD9844|nr:site-specific integrase [Leptospira perolatii]
MICELLLHLSRNENHSLWFRMIYSLGLFIKELIELKVGDINWENYEIRIRGEGTSRDLMIPEYLRRDLWFRCQKRKPEDPLFEGRSGKLHPRTVQKMFVKLQERSGIRVNNLLLRKSSIVHMMEVGWDQSSILAQVGFTTKRALRKYGKCTQSQNPRKQYPLEEFLRKAA